MMTTEWIDPRSPENRRNALCLLLIGMFAATRISIGGKLGISEFFMLICAPIIFIKNVDVFRREKIMGFLGLVFLWICGAVFSDWYNGTYYLMALKGIASPLMVLVNCIVLYVLFRKNPQNIRFFLLGLAISAVISTFVFQKTTDEDLMLSGSAHNAISAHLSYKLFWGNMVQEWLGVFIAGWYLKNSRMLSVTLAFMIVVAYVVCGGRSAAAAYLVTTILIFIGGTKFSSMVRIRRCIIPIVILIGIAGVVFKSAYKYAAVNELLNESEARKYELQTGGGKSSFLSLLMSGRSETFIATIAALDHPIVGHGSHAIDNNYYVADFFNKYGSDLDRQLYCEANLSTIHQIPFHTQIAGFWMWHGIFALLFWGYVLYLIVSTLIRRMAVFPPLFGYFALVLPAIVWDIFFSPFGLRVRESAIFVMCLIVRNMANGIKYPIEMRNR